MGGGIGQRLKTRGSSGLLWSERRSAKCAAPHVEVQGDTSEDGADDDS